MLMSMAIFTGTPLRMVSHQTERRVSGRQGIRLKVPLMVNDSEVSGRFEWTSYSKSSPITADSEYDEDLDESDNDEDANDEVDDTVENEKELPLIAATSPYDDLVAQLYRIFSNFYPAA
ncbi:hypothetical protein BGX27_004862 [Mortierella sp. AM989]|nr:hypothetical protein BGX27_004862 [Mortierella sp. AM989]